MQHMEVKKNQRCSDVKELATSWGLILWGLSLQSPAVSLTSAQLRSHMNSALVSVSSYLSLRPGSAGATGKLPLLPGPDPLAIRRALSHRTGQVRDLLPRFLPHLQRNPPSGTTFRKISGIQLERCFSHLFPVL